jgi:hypothetical protein
VSVPPSTAPSRTPAGPPGRRRWVWYFALLAALAAVAVVIPIVYNLGQQLRPEQLAEARARWRQNGARDYDLAFEVRFDADPRADEHAVRVRDGQVVSWLVNGEEQVRALPPRRLEAPADSEAILEVWKRPDVEGLFNMIAKRQEEDAAAGGRRNFATVRFDSRDGHPLRYVHRVAGTRQRQEWNIKLTRLPADAATDRR